MTLLVNMIGAPGAGKSRISTGVFSELKFRGVNAEYVSEVFKDFTWESRHVALECQPYGFSKQLRDITRVMDKVTVAITDGALFNSVYYASASRMPYLATDEFVAFVLAQTKRLGGDNYLIERTQPYNPAGRSQSESESDKIGKQLEYLLQLHGIKYKKFPGEAWVINEIVEDVMSKI